MNETNIDDVEKVPIESKIFWDMLSAEDIREYWALCAAIGALATGRNADTSKLGSFTAALSEICKYIEKSPQTKQIRAIVTGVCFAGPFICVNTKHLQKVMNRCKSSINNCFQHMGYLSIHTKGKSRSAVQAILPLLLDDSNAVRQWSARIVGTATPYCFISSFSWSDVPEVTISDMDEGVAEYYCPVQRNVGSTDLTPREQQVVKQKHQKELPCAAGVPFRASNGLYDKKDPLQISINAWTDSPHFALTIGEYNLRNYAVLMKARLMNSYRP